MFIIELMPKSKEEFACLESYINSYQNLKKPKQTCLEYVNAKILKHRRETRSCCPECFSLKVIITDDDNEKWIADCESCSASSGWKDTKDQADKWCGGHSTSKS